MWIIPNNVTTKTSGKKTNETTKVPITKYNITSFNRSGFALLYALLDLIFTLG